MTQIDTDWQLGDMPDFDPIDMKRRIQAELYEETKHMTPAQRREHTRRASKEFQEEGRRYRAALAESADN